MLASRHERLVAAFCRGEPLLVSAKINTTVGSEAEALRIVQQALPHAVEVPPDVAGKPYPKAASSVKAWYQVQAPEPEVNNLLPHIKYEDWTAGKKFQGGRWGHISFPPG